MMKLKLDESGLKDSCKDCYYQHRECNPIKISRDNNLPHTCYEGYVYIRDESSGEERITKTYYIQTVNLEMFGMRHNDTATELALRTVLTKDGLDSLVKNGSIQELTSDGLDFYLFKTKIKGHFENIEFYKNGEWGSTGFDDCTYGDSLESIENIGLQYYRIKKDKYIMTLSVGGSGFLNINIDDVTIGYINYDGECHILNSDNLVKQHQNWLNNGKMIDPSEINWKDGEYYINDFLILTKAGESNCNIYDFDFCLSLNGCQDENIKRFKHNARPILY